jgi:predicted aspartyl protease
MRTAQAGFKTGKGNETPADLLERFGPTILVDVGVKSRSTPGQTPDLAGKRIRALIDTGADGNCIDDALARKLGLPQIDKGEVSGIGGKSMAAMYLARMYIPQLERLIFEPLAGVRLEEGDQWHRAVLGRRFLRQYRMTYDARSGQVEIAEDDPPRPLDHPL